MIALIWLLACGDDVEGALAGLASENPAVREDAVIAAREVDDERVIAALEALLADPDAAIRLEAVISLGQLESPTSVQPLAQRVNDPDARVARAAVAALGRLGDPAAGPALIAAVNARPDAPPLDAIWALGACKVGEARPLLTKLRGHDDAWVRYNADVALTALEATE